MIQTFTLTLIQKDVLKTLLYFDVFNYPLKFNEVFYNMPVRISKEDLSDNLQCLIEEGFIKEEKSFYLLSSSSVDIIDRRLKGNAEASETMHKAYYFSKKIASFPFISGVCISGSLSKNYYDEHSDIDYFVITKANRLWICRMVFILYYKTLSKKEKNNYCLNYFISEADLLIPDKNDFVATELAYLLPTVNYSMYKRVLKENSWYKKKFLNKGELPDLNCIEPPNPWYKKAIEFMFYGKFGDRVDDQLLYITLKHWQRKYPELSQEDFELQFRSRKNVCKYHSKGHQNKVLLLWEEKIKLFEKKFDVSLDCQ
ncbi:MAG: nucleotidyltransferase domain-containing protein [Burkholderiales bacterium]|nr:nucleotidyltransferase domain-containing protein [Bacteroidia bacterium]